MTDAPGATRSTRLGAADRRRLRAALLAWYKPRSRPLRIRMTKDPWAILVAEVMAQQTQIGRVDVAWPRFMAMYPTAASLAGAPTGEVLRAWAGLGYNRRAVALQRTAQVVLAEHSGRVPSEVEALLALPGIGPYTARAVAAVAFGQPVAAVDTNVRRVVKRLLGRPTSAADLQATADELVDPVDPPAWTHATMDLGATVCRPRRPLCDDCPISRWCASAGIVEEPLRIARAAAAAPFERTSRWLRGRIVAHLRGLDGGAWTRLPSEIGSHGPEAVAAAVTGLERDGLLERRPDGAVRLPSTPT